MNMTRKIHADARGTLFDTLDDHRVGMLGVVGSDQHMQPMTHFTDRNESCLWFITSRDTELVRDIGMGAQAQYCVTTGDGTLYACLTGALKQSDNREKLDELWSSVSAAWFDDGRKDSEVTLLCLSLRNAGVWTATNSNVVFGLEVVRANLSGEHKPDVGNHVVVEFGKDKLESP
jgi:general stress protein 26